MESVLTIPRWHELAIPPDCAAPVAVAGRPGWPRWRCSWLSGRQSRRASRPASGRCRGRPRCCEQAQRIVGRSGRARPARRFLRAPGGAQPAASGGGPGLFAAPVRMDRKADLSRPDPDQPADCLHRVPAGDGGRGAARHPGRVVQYRAGGDQSDRADLPAGVAAGLAADRDPDRQRGLRDQRQADVREIVPGLRDHRHPLLALDDPDQHRDRRQVGRQGPGQRRQGAATAAARPGSGRSSCPPRCRSSSPACACRSASAGWC